MSEFGTAQAPPGGYATSHDEVIKGLSSVAVPLCAPEHSAAIAVVYVVRATDVATVADRLLLAAVVMREWCGCRQFCHCR